jgi:hypothetical protein
MRDLADGMTTCLNEAAASNNLILRFREAVNDSAMQSPGFAQLTNGKSANLSTVFAESDCGRVPTLNFAPAGRSL